MTLTRQGELQRWTEDWCKVTLNYTLAEADLIPGPIAVDAVTLVWRRVGNARWKRYAPDSRAEGYTRLAPELEHLVRRGPRRSKAVFDWRRGELMPWTDACPGLRDAVEEVEMELRF